MGLSLGAQQLTNVLGHAGENCKITAAFVVQCPFDLGKAVDIIKDQLYGLLDYGLGCEMH